jgi:hypothetical protein
VSFSGLIFSFGAVAQNRCFQILQKSAVFGAPKIHHFRKIPFLSFFGSLFFSIFSRFLGPLLFSAKNRLFLPFFEKTNFAKKHQKIEKLLFCTPENRRKCKKTRILVDFWGVFGGSVAEMPSGSHILTKKTGFSRLFSSYSAQILKKRILRVWPKTGVFGGFSSKTSLFRYFFDQKHAFRFKTAEIRECELILAKNTQKTSKIGGSVAPGGAILCISWKNHRVSTKLGVHLCALAAPPVQKSPFKTPRHNGHGVFGGSRKCTFCTPKNRSKKPLF